MDDFKEVLMNLNRGRITVSEAFDEYQKSVGKLEKENESLKEALTPSSGTKSDYIGEFSFPIEYWNEDEEEFDSVKIEVPWTTIKSIMKRIMARAVKE